MCIRPYGDPLKKIFILIISYMYNMSVGKKLTVSIFFQRKILYIKQLVKEYIVHSHFTQIIFIFYMIFFYFNSFIRSSIEWCIRVSFVVLTIKFYMMLFFFCIYIPWSNSSYRNSLNSSQNTGNYKLTCKIAHFILSIL